MIYPSSRWASSTDWHLQTTPERVGAGCITALVWPIHAALLGLWLVVVRRGWRATDSGLRGCTLGVVIITA